MKAFLLLACLALVTTASAYTDCQQAMYDGTRLSWKMATAYAAQDTATYNTLVDQWNAWVDKNFGQDPALLMKKMTGPVDLSKPYILANNTTGGGIVHAIDGSTVNGPSYTTNDVNLLPDSVRYNATTKSYAGYQGDFLGGI